MRNQTDQKDDQEDDEQYLGNARRRGGYSAKTQECCNNRKNQKHYSPIQHNFLLDFPRHARLSVAASDCAWKWAIALGEVGAGFTCGRDILRAGDFQDFLRALDPIRIIAVDRQQDAAAPYPTLVAFRLVFGDAHSRKRAGYAADRSTYAEAGKRRHDRSCGNEGPDSGNRQSADANQPSQGASDHPSGHAPGGSALRSFSALFVSEILRSCILRKENRNIGIPKSCRLERIHAALDACIIGVNAENSSIFLRHLKSAKNPDGKLTPESL